MINLPPFEYYLNLIRNGEVLTDIEVSNAKKKIPTKEGLTMSREVPSDNRTI